MAYLNKVLLIGNTGRDPEFAVTQTGRKRATLSLATTRRYRDSNGEQKEQISLYIDHERLQAYGIGQQMLFSRLQAQGITTMSGSINDDDQQIPIHVEAMENSEEEIANQIIFSDPITGKVARVRDVARVVREYEPMSSRIEQDGHPCVLLSMEMTGNDTRQQCGAIW